MFWQDQLNASSFDKLLSSVEIILSLKSFNQL